MVNFHLVQKLIPVKMRDTAATGPMTPPVFSDTQMVLFTKERWKENSADVSANERSDLPVLPVGHGKSKNNNQKDQSRGMVIQEMQ